MGTCGIAPPPRRAAPHATPGAMDPRRAQTRSDNALDYRHKYTGIIVVVVINNYNNNNKNNILIVSLSGEDG